MSTKFKAPDGARSFILTLAISESGESAVMVEEAGSPNRTVATVPKGEFGVREGLRVGGNLVREFYRNKQRELVLTERAAAVKRKRDARIEERAGKALEARQAPKAQPTEAAPPDPVLPAPSFTGDFGPNGDATTPGFFDTLAVAVDLREKLGEALRAADDAERGFKTPDPDRELTTPDPPPAPSAGSVAAAALRRKGFGDFTGGKQ
jgi:hypothetical protein